MKAEQFIYSKDGWSTTPNQSLNVKVIFAFFTGSKLMKQVSDDLKSLYPNAKLVGCSSAGNIMSMDIHDDSIVISTLEFSDTEVNSFNGSVNDTSLEQLCADANQALHKPNLKWLFVLSDGLVINASELTDNINKHFSNDVLITGGVAADGEAFIETQLWNDKQLESGSVVFCGFYSDSLKVVTGSSGGWEEFGPARQITEAKDNCLYSLDNEPALSLYKKVLGPYAKELPGSALRFPLKVYTGNGEESVIRSIMDVSEDESFVKFAGNIPSKGHAKLMKANFDKLIEGACESVDIAMNGSEPTSGIAILISCIGRRHVLGPRTEEELEAISEKLGDSYLSCGFYSGGEISTHKDGGTCLLHNQTMTVTIVSE